MKAAPPLHELLPPPAPPPRAVPWRTLLVLLIPAAALAAGTGLQRISEGPLAAGDTLLRWLWLSTAAGVLVGLIAGFARRGVAGSVRHAWLGWALYGAAAPWLVAALVAGTAHAVKPVREFVADRREASCQKSGRSICTVREFRASCESANTASLGAPRTRTCGATTCTSRWLYNGPFRPDNYVAAGSLLCTLTVDTQGHLARASVLPNDEE